MQRIIIILLLCLLYPEKLVYSVGFKFINVGTATISSKENKAGELTIHTIIKTNKFFDNLYKLRDEINLIVDPEDYSIKKVEKDILEGSWEQHYVAEIDSNYNVITKKKVIKNTEKLFDPISVIYSIRNEILDIGNKYSFSVLGIDEIRPIIVEVKKKETIKVPTGTYKCKKVIPASADDKPILKNSGYMTVWFTDDEKKIPVKIEQQTNIGNMVLKLKKITP